MILICVSFMVVMVVTMSTLVMWNSVCVEAFHCCWYQDCIYSCILSGVLASVGWREVWRPSPKVDPGALSYSMLWSKQSFWNHWAPCGLRGCKKWPVPFPGRMSYKATKTGLVSVLYLSIHYMVSLFIRATFYVLLSFHCYVCCLLVVLVKLSVH